ncbi:MAG: hypothetical protein WAL97_08435 [Halobacteriota archaeon]
MIYPWIWAERLAFTKTSIVAQENTFISSPDFKKKDETETKSLNMIGARFNVSMQQEPGFAERPYLKTRSFRWRARAPCWSPYFFSKFFVVAVVSFDL